MNNKGINLIALIIMIIIIILLAAIAMSNSYDAHTKAQVARAKEENLSVTTAVQNRYGEYVTHPTVSPLVGIQIPKEYDTVEKMKEFIESYLRKKGKLSTQNYIYYTELMGNGSEMMGSIETMLKDNIDYLEYTRILEHSHLTELGLESLPVNAMFVVNYFGTDVIGPIY